MIIDEFHFAFDKCKSKIESYMYYYDGTEFYKYFYQLRKMLYELKSADEINSLYRHVVFLADIIYNISKEQNKEK